MPAVDPVTIANMALSNIGATSSIESFEEGTAEANEVALWYDFSRLQALEINDWSFARKRLTLAAHTDDPPSGVWTFRYQYPSDCVMFRKFQNPAGDAADAVPFEIELDDAGDNKSLLTNLDDGIGVYTKDLETTTLYTPLFIQMLSFALAANIAFALTGKMKIRENMVAAFNSMQMAAPASNANEQMRPPERDAQVIRERQ